MISSSNEAQTIKDANSLFKHGDYASALRLYQEICAKYPKLQDSLRLNMRICRTRLRVNNADPKRAIVFAGFSDKGRIEDHVISYLAQLRTLSEVLVYVCDNDLLEGERDKLNGISDHVISGRHHEHDLGSYKRGFYWLKDQCLLVDLDWIVLCNGNCYAPVRGFEPMFKSMETSPAEFWGFTTNTWPKPYLQSYYLGFNKHVFSDPAFREFLICASQSSNPRDIFCAYELEFAKLFGSLGYSWKAQLEISGEEGQKPILLCFQSF